ncbi:MAG: plasmid recombination protein [Ruminococcus sp.]|nr:plasmid recombination protein [Ruminococcus sp.]
MKQLYHELFDEALAEFNARQTRRDRRITNYQEHIRHSRQEKEFYEVLFQVGNREDTGLDSEMCHEAAEVLAEYARTFQERNPHLILFNAVVHLDESTPHLHLDFVPVSDEARKNGMRVRNSLTGALRQQGYTGKGISKTITMDWLEQEKAHIGQLMLEHGIEWVKLGTHEKHKTVSQFKADKLREEIEAAESVLEQKQQEITSAAGQLEAVGSELAQQRQQLSDGMQELSSVKEQISSAQDDLDQKVKQVNDILKYLPNITRDDKMEQQYDNIRYELMDMLKSGLSIIRNKDDIVDKIDKLYGIVKKAIDAAYKYSHTIYDLRQLCEKYGKELAETKDKVKDLSKRNRELNKENEALSAENDYLNELYEQIRQIMPSVLTMAKDRVRGMHEQQQQQAYEQQKRKRSWGLE